jgi:hypothetical protein
VLGHLVAYHNKQEKKEYFEEKRFKEAKFPFFNRSFYDLPRRTH